MSRDFARHSVAYFMEPVIAHHDHFRFEIYCYSNNPKPDDVTERFKSRADHWRDIAFTSDDDVFQQIITDGIDILIDLSGHTTGNRLTLLARKPAPVQANYLGYPATTGMRAMDYRIVDGVTDPPAEADGVSCESLVRLPYCFLTYEPPPDSPAVSPPPSVERGHITFGSFNSLIKVNHAVVALWAKVLHAIPGSRLMLKGFAFSSEATMERFVEMFAGEGIAAEQLDLMSWHPEIRGHLELYSQIDVALDPFPYNGTTTTCEALWMGVPVLTLAGDHHSARVGASLLSAVGLSEFVNFSRDEYVACAIRLCTDLARLAALRTSLRERMKSSPLLDAEGFARRLEFAYDTMWQNWLGKHGDSAARPSTTQARALCTLNLPDNVRICLPDSLEGMTRYIVEEQGDWFEHEMPFVRTLVGQGMNAIDIGANFGVYALALARCVGAAGHVWAFEPTPYVAAALRQSCVENHYAQVEVIEAAVAERSGRGQLLDRGGAELQQIILVNDTAAGVGAVAVTSLDDWADVTGFACIEFVKVDAEGQEVGIVRGGQTFFTIQSPLVMAEYLNGAERNDEMIGAFADLGYGAWRLVPSLQILVPVASDDEILIDAPPLNLFFCKPDRAEALAAADRLVLASTQMEINFCADRSSALSSLFRLPFAAAWVEAWDKWMEANSAAAQNSAASGYRRAIECYALSRNVTFPRSKRWCALSAALDAFSVSASSDAAVARELTHARVLYDAGLAPRARGMLGSAIHRLQDSEPELVEPFVPPAARYEHITPSDPISNWLLASCFEQLEIVNALTGYLDPAASLRRLRDIRTLGYGSKCINQRIDLIVRRFDQRSTRLT